MPTRFRCRILILLFILMATAGLIGVAAHGHISDSPFHCWLCISSFGTIGLSADVCSFDVTWVLLGILDRPSVAALDVLVVPHRLSRAPPFKVA